jgi:hypothetical protein
MARIFVFADEAGNFDFSGGRGASRYFILTTVALEDCSVGDALLALRRQLAWEGVEQATVDFHATEELQAVRDRVFALLGGLDFRVDVSIFNKAKVTPHLQADQSRFYKQAWFLHFKYVVRQIANTDDEMLVITAALGTKNLRAKFKAAVEDVVYQVAPTIPARVAQWAGASDPCLWLADWCCWAVQRKWERSDHRSHAFISSKIKSEFEFFNR